MENKEPVFVRAARFVLENGCTHVDNMSGRLVHNKKVERALAARGVFMWEDTEEDEAKLEEPVVIKRKKGGPKINPVLLDATTASMIVQVYEKLEPKNGARFDELVARLTAVGFIDKLWKLVSKPKAA